MARLRIDFNDEQSEVARRRAVVDPESTEPDVAPSSLAPISLVDAGSVRGQVAGVIIGRDRETCAVVLDHPTVSRQHAAIRRQGGVDVIEDVGSATGVRVNGQPVAVAQLAPGDEIAIGPFRLVYDGGELVHRDTSSGLDITTYGVTVEAGGGLILQPTSVAVRGGELVGIIGESGAGKSTLLKLMAGVDTPTAGRVLAGDDDVSTVTTDIGYVPQFDIVHGALTIREALEYAARLRLPQDTIPNERAARIDAVLAQLGLTDRADIRVDRLSGGQRKRVAVGVELLHGPRALFLDEPTTGLDPGLERRLTMLFRTLADAGQTVAYVTHATASIEACDRILVMGRGGVLCFDGPPAAVLKFFGVERFDDVYAELDRHDPGNLAQRRASQAPPLAPPPALAFQPKGLRLLRQSFGFQVSVLVTRDVTILLRDRRYVRGMLVQVPALGLLTALLFGRTVFTRAHGDQTAELFAGKAAQLIFLMVTIAIWMGSINAARQIVKERSVLSRELAIGVRPEAYIVSKVLVLFSVTTIQTVAFAAVVLTLRPLHGGIGQAQHLVVVLVIAGWVAVLLGLVVSAYATSEDQATGVIPLLLVPQLLFGGAIVAVQDMTGVMKIVATLVPARWAFAAAGSAIHMHDRIVEDPSFSQVSRYGTSFFDLALPLYFLIACVFAAVLVTVLHRLLLRPV